ncbi:MAG: efflux RND transporter periplasmic adaptor subunit [Planctomycetota bacterium]
MAVTGEFRWSSLGVALGVCILLLPVGPSGAQPPPAPVLVDDVRAEQLAERRLVTGEIRARDVADVAGEEPGRVLEVAVREGATVARGATVVRLDATRLQLEADLLRAEQAVAESVVVERRLLHEQAVRDRELLAELIAQNATNPKELADATSDENVAATRIEQAEGELRRIATRLRLVERRIQDMTITAPFAGVVTQRYRDVGEWVGEGEAVAKIVSTEGLEAWLAVPQPHLAAMHASRAPLQIRVVATGQEYVGQQPRVVPQVDTQARNFPLIVALQNATAALAPGMSVTARIPVGSNREQLTVARDAILIGDLGSYVYVVRTSDQGAQAFPSNVKILFANGDRVVVTGGNLKPGDAVVVEGNERLFPSAPVIPKPRAAAEGKQP